MNVKVNLEAVKLSDKYEVDKGRIFITGTQAIVRLPIIQKSLDVANGLNTAGFISGYRGSPMGMVDNALWREQKRLAENNIVFQPGVNEDLAATAIWGTQQIESFPDQLVDGVFSIWYGKGPGVDRSGDVFRHGNMAGTHKNGGVLVVYGDDHPGKSSTVVCQSEPALAAMHIPSLYPSNVQEIIDFGILGWALSRYSGLWVGIKCVNETVEQTQTVDVDFTNISIAMPDRGASETVVNLKPGYMPPTPQEIVLKRHRLPLVHKFVKANNIDKTIYDGRGGLGIVTSGKTYGDVIQALELLGIDDSEAKKIGLSIYKVGCIWPLEPSGIIEFSKKRSELLFIEEKNSILEDQATKIFINKKKKPLIVGKVDQAGKQMFVSDEQLDSLSIAPVIAKRLAKVSIPNPVVQKKCKRLEGFIKENALTAQKILTAPRIPYFCSGCPHNSSTKLPKGSLAMAGIGCHAMAIYTRKDTLPPTHMGGEGMNWAGAAHFSGTKHMFQNLGDGTYFHSGLLAIRGAVAARVNITYKILYNDAVAMTGGQPIDGPISVAKMVRQVNAEGISKCVIVTDKPEQYRNNKDIPSGTNIYHRNDLEFIQTQLRECEGTSVIIYEQTCAAELRRRRKRGTSENPAKRMYINSSVCEGCGDCSVQSTCVSIHPLETEFGTKRIIDQSSCNKDYSCVNGFCPSFVTVANAEPKKPQRANLDSSLLEGLPYPVVMPITKNKMNIMIAGIGGTGVITVGAIVGMAAHLEGKACSIYDMTGLSQKNGAVYSHLCLADNPNNLAAQRIGLGEADLVLGFDLIASLTGDSGTTFNKNKTTFVGNVLVSPTSNFQFDRDLKTDNANLKKVISKKSATEKAYFIDATTLALKLCGDTIASNMFMVGYTAQKGFLPVSVAALEKAIELNGIAVPFNLNAFSLGRLFAFAPEKVQNLLPNSKPFVQQSLHEIIQSRVELLTKYQNKAYARQFSQIIDKVRNAEHAVRQTNDTLSKAVAENLSKLMSYKDEYEVARLYTDPIFQKQIAEQFEPGFKLRFNLAPPLFSKKNKSTGTPMKNEYGAWVLVAFKILVKMKRLRGTRFDVFGLTTERRMERKLLSDYIDLINKLLFNLNSKNLEAAIELASLPNEIRGFGHVKIDAVKNYELIKFEKLQAFIKLSTGA